MERITDGADAWLRLLVAEMSCELANQAIGSASVRFASTGDALQAIARRAYLKGRADEAAGTADFEADVAAVQAANTRQR